MNDSIINRFVNNLPFEMHLWDPKVGKYSACGPGTKHSDRVRSYIKTGNTDFIFKNNLDKACFYHDSGYTKYKDVEHRHIYDRQLMNAAANIANDQNIDGPQRALAALITTFFQKKLQMGQGVKNKQSEEDWKRMLSEQLHT